MVDVSGVPSEGFHNELQRQIDDLRSEMARMAESISSIREAADEGSSWYDSASETAGRASSRLKSEAISFSETVQENPTAITSVLAVGIVIGLLMGFGFAASDRRW
jgi:hypothetical protein